VRAGLREAIFSAGNCVAPAAFRRGAADTNDMTCGSGTNFASAVRAATQAASRTASQTSRGRVMTKPKALIGKR
jgi:hypothetical protein